MRKHLESKLVKFDLVEATREGLFDDSHKPITVWLSLRLKKKYDLVQRVTNKKFSKYLRDLIDQELSKIEIEDEST